MCSSNGPDACMYCNLMKNLEWDRGAVGLCCLRNQHQLQAGEPSGRVLMGGRVGTPVSLSSLAGSCAAPSACMDIVVVAIVIVSILILLCSIGTHIAIQYIKRYVFNVFFSFNFDSSLGVYFKVKNSFYNIIYILNTIIN